MSAAAPVLPGSETTKSVALRFALVSPDGQGSSTKSRLRELTLAWSRYGYHEDIVEAHSVDAALRRVAASDAQYCLLQTAGHVIDEQWYLPHWQREGFYQGMQRLMGIGDFLVAGEWLTSPQGGLSLQTDCLLVDMRRYRVMGQPSFGAADSQTRELLKGQESDPDQLISASSAHQVITKNSGWQFIETSFRHGIPVRRFGHAINDCRFNLASDKADSTFANLIGQAINKHDFTHGLTPDQVTFISRIKTQFEDAQKGVFLFNIEPYDDLKKPSNQPPLDAVFSVAAGFKPYRILQSQGFHAETKVVLFDYSQKALAVRKHIIDHWDGRDFPTFVRHLFKRFPPQEVFYQLWHGVTPDTLDWSDMETLWQQELNRWGGADAFAQQWQTLRALPHQYLHCDLLRNRQSLLDELANHQHSYLWWSNAFFTIFSHWHYRPAERKAQYFDWVAEVARAAPSCQINGADHNNMAVNGLSALEYLDTFNQLGCDELVPQRIRSVDIQF